MISILLALALQSATTVSPLTKAAPSTVVSPVTVNGAAVTK